MQDHPGRFLVHIVASDGYVSGILSLGTSVLEPFGKIGQHDFVPISFRRAVRIVQAQGVHAQTRKALERKRSI